MTTTILLGAYLNGVVLSATDTTIAHSGSIYNNGGAAVLGPGGTAWTISNYGTVTSTAADGVSLAAGGLVTNAASATITGYYGVDIAGAAGVVVNAGLVSGTGRYGVGVSLAAGGAVTNTVSGYIRGYFGIGVSGAAATVVNAGTIQAYASGTSSTGILLKLGGYVSNAESGVIDGSAGVYSTAAATVVNMGMIAGTAVAKGSAGVDLQAGGTVSNASYGVISGFNGIANYGTAGDITIVNDGTLLGSGSTFTSAGIYLLSGGFVSNTVSGTIAGYTGVYAKSGSLTATVINDGTISGTGTLFSAGGIDLVSGGFVSNASSGRITGYEGVFSYNVGAVTLVNAGSIIATGHTFSAGAYLGSGSSVTNSSGGVILGNTGVLMLKTAGMVNNAGTIGGLGGFGYSGIQFDQGGTVTNAASGAIYGYAGVDVRGSSGTVINAGSIGGSGADGVTFRSGGYVNNMLSAAITGYTGVNIAGGSGTVVNAGTIGGVGLFHATGISLSSGGLVSNAAAGVITGYTGIYALGLATVDNSGQITGTSAAGYEGISLAAGGTVFNAGTITGVAGIAIGLGYNGGGGDRLIINPGAVFQGSVVAQTGILPLDGNTLELASAGATGTLTGVGSAYAGFGTITSDANATWVVAGSVIGGGTVEIGAASEITFNGSVASAWATGFTANTGTLGLGDPAGFSPTVYGFRAGNTFDFTSISSAGSLHAGIFGSNLLTLASSGTVLAQVTIAPSPSLATATFLATPDGRFGTFVTEGPPICFLPGTMIATPLGETEVERLHPGDTVLTAGGQERRIVWIGAGRVLATRGQRSAATPVIVRKGALAENVPHHDLRISKAHSLFLDGVLIPVEFLVNHRSILWDDRAQEVSLYHIELETHDVLLANGAAAESYRDDGNRWLFQNANDAWGQPPQRPCARVLTEGPVLDAIWQRLLDRSGPRPRLLLTGDPDLHVVVDGQRIDAASRDGAFHVFRLAVPAPDLHVLSRSAAPQELGLHRDPRLLGVALRQVLIRQGTRRRVIEVDDARLTDGFHRFEPDNGWRWTDGDAVLPAALFAGFAGTVELVLHCGAATQYVDDGKRRRVA